MNEFYDAFELNSWNTWLYRSPATKGDLTIMMFRREERTMTDITELAQSLKAEDISSERMEWLKKLADMGYCANNPSHWLMNLKETNYLTSLALQCLESNSTLVEALASEKRICATWRKKQLRLTAKSWRRRNR